MSSDLVSTIVEGDSDHPQWENWGSEEDATSQGPLISKWQGQDSTRAQDPNDHIMMSAGPGQAQILQAERKGGRKGNRKGDRGEMGDGL